MLLLQLLFVLISLSCHHLSRSTVGPTVTHTTDDNNEQQLLLPMSRVPAPAPVTPQQEHLVNFYQSFYRFFPPLILIILLFRFFCLVILTEAVGERSFVVCVGKIREDRQLPEEDEEDEQDVGRRSVRLITQRLLEVLEIGDKMAAAVDGRSPPSSRMPSREDHSSPSIQRSARQTPLRKTDNVNIDGDAQHPPRYAPHAGYIFYSFPFLSFTLPFGGHLKLFGQNLI